MRQALRYTPVFALVLMSVAAHAQFSTVNSVVVSERFYNDFPNSSLTTVNNFPAQVSFRETLTPNAAGGGFANRHLWDFSNNGITAYSLTGPDDYFDISFDLNLTSSGSIRKEAGFFIRTNSMTSAPALDAFHIVNSDAGERVIFGDPFPFYLFGNNGNANGYTAGSTIRMGMKYFKDTDDLYKVIWTSGSSVSPAQTLTNYNGYNFGALGLPMGTTISMYAQFTGAGQDASATFSNISPAGAVPEPASLAALGIGALALLRRRRRIG